MEKQPEIIWDIGGRGGSVTYKDHRTEFYFPWEVMNAGYELEIPTAADWEWRTNLPLAERDEVLRLIGEEGVKRYGEKTYRFKIIEAEFCSLLVYD